MKRNFEPKFVRFGSEKGAELVEFAIILPLLLVLFAGIWEFGAVYRTYQALTNGAREGARLAVLPQGINQTEAVRRRVKNYLSKSNLQTSFISDTANDSYLVIDNPANNSAGTTVTVTLPGGGTTLVTVTRVSIAYPYNFVIFGPVMKLLLPGSSTSGTITLRTTVTMENQAS
jgi:Flp pilus assembly protein TadG